MKTKYIDKRFNSSTLTIIDQANTIITEYKGQGFNLTLRQLYYQFVSRDLIANKQSEYKRIGSIINDARLAGLIDWTAIEDRTRSLRRSPHWDSPSDIIKSCAYQYHVDMWKNQDYRPEVWIEKDALTGVIEDICDRYDVPYFSCRGYSSLSSMYKASGRFKLAIRNKQIPLILHFGDHDPSGIDMTRDIQDRIIMLNMFDLKVDRLALNYNQVEKFNPPPNPVKFTDSRSNEYTNIYGTECWELDALEPKVLIQLIEENILKLIDKGYWEDSLTEEQDGKDKLLEIANNM